MKKGLYILYITFLAPILLISQSNPQYELARSNFPDQKMLTQSAMYIMFSTQHKQAYWVAYPLSISKSTKIKRTNKFVADPEIAKTGQASNADYKRSGYDKGHLAPAADMSWSLKTMTESFYFSNMSPQKPQFNRVIWKNLEELVRTWAKKYGKIYIATGPILDSFIEYIGKGKIGAPTYFYKTILYYNPPKQAKAIAFIMKNEGSTKPSSFFAVSVDELEKRTNIDFFYQLPDEVEKIIEANSDFDIW